jgi:hypothetical protein
VSFKHHAGYIRVDNVLHTSGYFSTICQGKTHFYTILTTNLYDKSRTIQHQKDMLSKWLDKWQQLFEYYRCAYYPFLNMHVYIQGGQHTSYIRVFIIENFIMPELFPHSDKVRLMFILFQQRTCMIKARPMASYVMVIKSLMRWWWCPLCTKPTRLDWFL